MKTLTVKIFLKDSLFHFAVVTSLYILFDVMKSYPGHLRFDVMDAVNEIGWRMIPIYWFYISYCILFYHKFFKLVLLHVHRQRLLKVIIYLIIYFFVGDLLLTNIILPVKHQVNSFISFDLTFLFRFIVFTAYATAYSFIRGLFWLRIQKLQVEKEKAVASLHLLRSQIEPHFVFNSLNSVYAISMEEKAQKTAESIEELSSLFRYSLKDNTLDRVPVEEELGFIEKYIHLNKIRIQHNDHTKINTNIFWDKQPAFITPMLVITFVENAFKYGISLKKESFIDIHVSVEQGNFNLLVRNSLHEYKAGTKNGLGLKNTRNRLELLYPGKFSLDEKRYEYTYEVVLNINLI